MTSYCRSPFNLSARQRPTVGDIKLGVVNQDHLGWLKCDGRLLPVQQYYSLWQVIGYSFGGSGDLFYLPNPAGTVPGIVGTGTDSRISSFSFNLGQQYGEYEHVLTTPEMPIHGHTYSTLFSSTNITILNSTTQISVNVSTTGVYDSGHAHSYQQPGGGETYNTASITPLTIGSRPANTDTANANLVDPAHRHNLTDPSHKHDYYDPTHFHVIPPDGGSQPHNNIQPTLPMGNMFIFSGYYRNADKVTDPTQWPYGVLPNGQLNNIY